MSEKKLLAIISLLMALIGGILVLVGVFNVGRGTNINLDYLAQQVVPLILGIGAIAMGVYMYKGHVNTGGFLTVIIGVLIAVERGLGLAAALVILGGLLGIMMSEAR